jgi:hypothetical protein
MDASAAARGFAFTRLGAGAVMLALPRTSARLWLGPDTAKAPATPAVMRSVGGREVALAIGAIEAVQRDGAVRPWVFAGIVSDGADVIGALLSWRRLPRGRRGLVVLSAAGAVASGAFLAVRLTRERAETAPKPLEEVIP